MKRKETVARDPFGAVVRETWTGEALADFFETRRRENSEALTLSEWLDALEAWARKPFEGRGEPWASLARKAKPLSRKYFLGRILFDIQLARIHQEQGDVDRLFFVAARLGGNLRELTMRHRGLDLATSGKKQKDAGRKGGEMTASGSFKKVYGEQAQARADALAANRPDLSFTAICNVLAKELRRADGEPYGAKTIKNALTNPTKGK